MADIQDTIKRVDQILAQISSTSIMLDEKEKRMGRMSRRIEMLNERMSKSRVQYEKLQYRHERRFTNAGYVFSNY